MIKTNEKGFTLIELLIAVAILGFGTLTLAELMTTGIWINVKSKDDSQMSSVGQQYLESLFEVGYTDLVVGGDLNPSGTPDPLYSDIDVLVESSAASGTSDYHRNNVTYDVYWLITNGSAEIAESPYKEIAVRIVSDSIDLKGKVREATIRAQILRSF